MRPLTEDDFDAIHAAFNAAFSDYVVPFSLTPAQLRSMMTRRGWTPEASVGELPAGFVLNCIDGNRAYNMGTGTAPAHRRTGLARRLMEKSIEIIGNREYILEVIASNEKAVRLYETLGFETVRTLDCWTFAAVPGAACRVPGPAAQHESWWDFEPSWQNSTASIRRAADPWTVIGDEFSYLVLFPDSGDVAQFAVAPEHRRRGLGRQLFEAAAALAARPLRVLNVDPSVAGFMTKIGATRLVQQLEMRLGRREGLAPLRR